jgi:hypothetical protein
VGSSSTSLFYTLDSFLILINLILLSHENKSLVSKSHLSQLLITTDLVKPAKSKSVWKSEENHDLETSVYIITICILTVGLGKRILHGFWVNAHEQLRTLSPSKHWDLKFQKLTAWRFQVVLLRCSLLSKIVLQRRNAHYCGRGQNDAFLEPTKFHHLSPLDGVSTRRVLLELLFFGVVGVDRDAALCIAKDKLFMLWCYFVGVDILEVRTSRWGVIATFFAHSEC